MDFTRRKSDILQDTYDLIDDIKSGKGIDIDKCFDRFFSRDHDDFFSSDFDFGRKNRRRNRTTDLGSRFRMSFPNFSSCKRTTTETDSEPDTYNKTRIKRSESTYSTSSYDTTDSNDTLSEMSDSSFSPTSSKGRSYVHNRTSSSDSSRTGELNKKYEDEFLNDERHSMPHEIYSKCDSYLNNLDLDRPRSVPPESAYSNLHSNFKDTGSNYNKCYPGKQFMDARNSKSFAGNSAFLSNIQGHRRYPSTGSDRDSFSESRSTVAGSGNRLNSLSSFDFPSLSDVNSNFEGDLRSPCPISPTPSSRSSVALSGNSNTLVKTPYKSEPALDGAAISDKLKGENRTWEERQGRIEDALKWLKSELGSLREQDKQLLEDLSKCQNTIETIKKQRANQINEDDEDIEEEEGHWEDWEIAEFDRKCREDKEAEEKQMTLNSESKTVTGANVNLPQQDVQAVL